MKDTSKTVIKSIILSDLLCQQIEELSETDVFKHTTKSRCKSLKDELGKVLDHQMNGLDEEQQKLLWQVIDYAESNLNNALAQIAD